MTPLQRTARAICHVLLFVATTALQGGAMAASWTYLDGPFGGQPFALHIDAAGNAWAGMNGAGVYSRAAGTSQWTLRPGMPTQSNARFAIGGTGIVHVSGSAGVFALAPGGTTWERVSGTNGLPGQAGSGMTSDAQGAVYVGMNGTGAVYKRAAGADAWAAVGTGLPAGTWVNNLVFDGAGNLWASINGVGVFKLPAGGATWTAMNATLGNLDVTTLAVVGNDLFTGNSSHGVYKLANASGDGSIWTQVSGGSLNAATTVAALAAGAGNVLYAAVTGGVHALASGGSTWTTVGDSLSLYGTSYSLAYSKADGALLLGNGSGIFVLPAGASAWQFSSDGMSANTISGLAVAGNGDVYAGTSGQGVQRLAKGAAAWSAVDLAGTGTTIQAIVVDNQGTAFMSAGGSVKKLVGGTWTAVNTNLGGTARSLAADAANAVWAGLSGSVRKLPAGASAWVEVGAGLPSGRNVGALAFDGAGTAHAGISGTGVYSLPAGGATWTANVSGLADLAVSVLARDADGAMLAGTGKGVFRLAGAAWQQVGTGLTGTVLSLVADGNGDLYAGVDSGYVWRLGAGKQAWSQVRLGLGSASAPALAIGDAHVYAGTNASRGSPSGVHVFVPLDTVVEFYNTGLDNYFITANPDEQNAVANGAAGPGWSATGNFFNAGGPSTVCRFYGSLSPGPNSHFYTIDPDECQALKVLQATTPATEKRWNFESNDFASTAPVGGQCAAGLVPVYRAYNNGFARNVDSNHRITANRAAYLAQVASGWSGEGVVMCAPAK